MKYSSFFFPLRTVSGFTEVDGSIIFYNVINARMTKTSVVLDFGAGRGVAAEDACAWRRTLAGTELWPDARRIAVDVDEAVLGNPFAREKHVLRLEGAFHIPLPENSVDIVICDWVVEHLADPVSVFREFYRVLRKGGFVAVRTSNRWHYAYLVATLLAGTSLSRWVMDRAQPDRKEEDIFPKYYRCNTRYALKTAFATASLAEGCAITIDAEPAYVGNGLVLNFLGFVYHRFALLGIVPRGTLLGFFHK